MEFKVLKASSKEILTQQISKVFGEGWIIPPFEEIKCNNGWYTLKVVKVPLMEEIIETLGKRHSTSLIIQVKNAVEKAYPEYSIENEKSKNQS